MEKLRALVETRLMAAAEEVWEIFEGTITRYEQKIHHQQDMLDLLLKPRNQNHTADPPRLPVCEEEVLCEQQERSPSLDQEEPEIPQIKEEQEEPWSSHEGEQPEGLEEADIKLISSPVSMKSEYDEEKRLSSQLRRTQEPQLCQVKQEEQLFQHLEETEVIKLKSEHEEEKPQCSWFNQTQLEESRKADPQPSTSTEQMEAKQDREDCGRSEPARKRQLLSSDGSGAETDDSDEWEETRGQQAGLNTLRPEDTQRARGQSTSVELSVQMKSTDCLPSALLCKMCDKPFPNRRSLMTHIRVHSCGCGLCGKYFEPTENLKNHLEDHRRCEVCGKIFTFIRDVMCHMKTHTGEKPYSCSVCGQRFGEKGNLGVHMRIHTGEKPFSCSVCRRSFGRKEHLRIHMRTHTGEKPFSCTICRKSFGRKEHLQIHMRIHTGEKHFRCVVCGKSFCDSTALGRHLQSHAGEKRFGCSVCGKRFADKGDLKTHIGIHIQQEAFTCTVCGKAFAENGSLTEHMEIHSGEKPYS